MSKPPPAGGPIVIDIVDFKRQNERESKDMCICISRLYLLSSFFSEANFPENADLVFVIFKNKRAKEDAERERERVAAALAE